MKKCTKCKAEKDVQEFNASSARKDGLQPYCRQCSSSSRMSSYRANRDKEKNYRDERRLANLTWLRELRQGLKCERCGENHPATLDFHHKNPEEKEGQVTRFLNTGYGKERVLKEISKCEILCSNCHRKLHFDGRNNTAVV